MDEKNSSREISLGILCPHCQAMINLTNGDDRKKFYDPNLKAFCPNCGFPLNDNWKNEKGLV
jgi:hypothetical protein